MKNFLKSWVYPFVIALVVTAFCGQTFGWETYCFAVFFGSFAISSKAFDYTLLKNTISSTEKEKILTHRDYALRDIIKVETNIQKSSTKQLMKLSLQDLENKLLGMFSCCEKEDRRRELLKDLRGNLGNFRTQL